MFKTIKWAVAVIGGLAVIAGVVCWQLGAPLSKKRPDTPAASSCQPTVARPQVLMREIVKVVETKEKDPVIEEHDPVQAIERARLTEVEDQAQREAYMETGFQAAAAPDQAAREIEGNLTAAFREADVRTSTVECRSSFCRIQVTFADEVAADMALHQIFLSGQDERVPNLASTVSRTIEGDGTVHVKIYLHPDHLAAYNPGKPTE